MIGGCNQDQSPRNHALHIAMLSAETTKWEIFLRSHLDIMNDRFVRITDGSYAYGARHTYIKELEVLDINVADLIFGISSRVTNPAENHYFGDLVRIGRALSESADADAIEASMLSMIADSNLDGHNRILMHYLFDKYNHYLKRRRREKAECRETQAGGVPNAGLHRFENQVRQSLKLKNVSRAADFRCCAFIYFYKKAVLSFILKFKTVF